MAKKFSDLRAKLPADVQQRARARADQTIADMPLQTLRHARELSQATIAELLGATQPQISKIEHRTDLYVSTLRRYVEALGGELEILARFPEGAVRINLFRQIDSVGDFIITSPTPAAKPIAYEVKMVGVNYFQAAGSWGVPKDNPSAPVAVVFKTDCLSSESPVQIDQNGVAA